MSYETINLMNGGPSYEQILFLTDNSPHPVVAINEKGEMIYCNQKVADLFPSLSKEGLSHPWLQPIANLVSSQKEHRQAYYRRTTIFNKHDFLQNIYYFPKQNIYWIMGLDITKQKEVDQRLRNAKKVAEKQNSFLNSILNSMEDFVFVYDTQGKLIRTNDAFKKLLGYDPTGISWQDQAEIFKKLQVRFVDSESNTYSYQPDISYFVNLNINSGTCFLTDLHGEQMVFTVKTSPILNQKKAIGAVTVMRNITEERKLDTKLIESESRYKNLFDGMSEGVIIFDIIFNKKGIPVDFKYVDVNSAYEKMTGFRKQDVVGKLRSKIFTDTDHRAIRDYKYIIKTGKSKHYEHYFPSFNKYLSTFGFCPNPGQYVVIFTDITESKALESRKDDFINIASHELKTPLTSIKAYSQFLARKITDTTNPKISLALNRIIKQTDKLTSLVTTMLDITKIQANRLTYQDDLFDLCTLIKETVEDIKLTSPKPISFKFDFSTLDKIKADRFRIEQVLTNLITNAIKYSPYSNTIVIRATTTKHLVKVAVKDEGVGIPEDKLEKIFERFYRIDNKSTGESILSSLGLGLYVTAEIVKRHGGKIWAKSKVGKGSTFYFTLPRLR